MIISRKKKRYETMKSRRQTRGDNGGIANEEDSAYVVCAYVSMCQRP